MLRHSGYVRSWYNTYVWHTFKDIIFLLVLRYTSAHIRILIDTLTVAALSIIMI